MNRPELSKALDDIQASMLQILGRLDQMIDHTPHSDYLESRVVDLKQAAGQLRATISFMGRARRK